MHLNIISVVQTGIYFIVIYQKLTIEIFLIAFCIKQLQSVRFKLTEMSSLHKWRNIEILTIVTELASCFLCEKAAGCCEYTLFFSCIMLYNALLYSELFPNIDVVKQDVNYIRATRIRNLFLNIICWWKECCIIYQGMVRFNMDNNVININKSEYINQHGFCDNNNHLLISYSFWCFFQL